MGGTAELSAILLLISAAVLIVCVFAGFLLVLNNNRMIRHRAELAEATRLREQEVLRAEREAVQQTLHEVGRELHDNVGQLLTVVQLGLNTVLDERDDARLSAAQDALQQGVDEVRRLGNDLNSDLWQRRTLVEAISAAAEHLERVGRIRAHVLVEGEPPALPNDTSTMLYRVFQEVVQNAVKHSGTDTLTITIAARPSFALTIVDNGRGFDLERTVGNGGLHNIRKRCALIGFEATCTSSPGGGSTWHIQQTPAP